MARSVHTERGMRQRTGFLLATALLGCHSPQAVLATPSADLSIESVRQLAAQTDARTMGLLALWDPTPSSAGSAGCPRRTREGEETVLQGGCDAGDERRDGVARLLGDPRRDGVYRVRYEGFGHSSTQSCGGLTYTQHTTLYGTTVVTGPASQRTFRVDLLVDTVEVQWDCVALPVSYAVSYAGSLSFSGPDSDGDGLGDQSEANGTGRFGSTAMGSVESSTRGLRWDAARCASEPLGGFLQLRAGVHEGVLTYDGATSCDGWRLGSAPFRLDGGEAVPVTVVGCSARPQGQSHGAVAFGGLSAGLLALRRRGRGRRRSAASRV